MCIVVSHTMTSAFEKRKGFIAKSTSKERGGEAQNCLLWRVWGGVYRSKKGWAGMQERYNGRFQLEGYIQHRTFLDKGPLASKRISVIKFQWSHSSLASGLSGAKFGSKCYWRSKFSPLACFDCMTHRFADFLQNKQTNKPGYLVWTRITPVWTGSVVTVLAYL